jgi:peptidoglycan/xylan/chitin deacetylase (PgdA/CDA1 family)
MSKIERIGIGVYGLCIVLVMIDIRLSTIPLACFLVVCLGAPFFPAAGFFLPTISHGISGKNAVAITFDDGPDPATTPDLLNLLARHGVPATFFVTGRHVDAYPDLVDKILSNGHSVGNHTYSHDNLVMLKSRQTLYKEIEAAQRALMPFGIRPMVFRPPVGITNPRLWQVLRAFNMVHLAFSCRAGDFGNRRIWKLSERILKRVRPDDIIILHDVSPKNPTARNEWLAEIDRIIIGLQKQGIAVLPLSELIGRPVMVRESRVPS